MIDHSDYCHTHSESVPLFPCKIFGDIVVGYYCVLCQDFIPRAIVPEVDVIRKLVKLRSKRMISRAGEAMCVQ
jgi:hypothetical protein